jgi:hypothetical protein
MLICVMDQGIKAERFDWPRAGIKLELKQNKSGASGFPEALIDASVDGYPVSIEFKAPDGSRNNMAELYGRTVSLFADRQNGMAPDQAGVVVTETTVFIGGGKLTKDKVGFVVPAGVIGAQADNFLVVASDTGDRQIRQTEGAQWVGVTRNPNPGEETRVYMALGARDYSHSVFPNQGNFVEIQIVGKQVRVVSLDRGEFIKRSADWFNQLWAKADRKNQSPAPNEQKSLRIEDRFAKARQRLESWYRPQGIPLEESAICCRVARILPDIHAGSTEFSDAYADMLSGRESGEFVVFQELIDRGQRGWEVVDKAREQVMKGEAAYIIGNHEGMFLAAMKWARSHGDRGFQSHEGTGMIALANWLREGGEAMLQDLGYDECKKFDRDNPFADPQLLQRIRKDLVNNPKLQKVRDLDLFLRERGKMYMIVNGVLATHAGILMDPISGNLAPMKGKKGEVLLNGAVGLDMFEAIEAGLRNDDAEIIMSFQSSPDECNPLWVREGFFRVVQDPMMVSAMRGQINDQMEKRYGDKMEVEMVVVGHTPERGDERYGSVSHPVDGRVLYLDKGFYLGGEQRILRLRAVKRQGSGVEDATLITYKDPADRSDRVINQVVHPLNAPKNLRG